MVLIKNSLKGWIRQIQRLRKIKYSLLLVLLFNLNSCVSQNIQYEGYPKPKDITTLEKANEGNPDLVKHLFVDNYYDTIFPNEEILKFKNLETLIVGGRRVKQSKNDSTELEPLKIIVDNSKLLSLNNLSALRLSYFDFSTFPIELCKLNKLKYLAISASFIDVIPTEIENLNSLEFLSFRLNNLKDLPNELSELKSLIALDLTNNDFTTIPDVLMKMSWLKLLVLANLESSTEREMGWNWPYYLSVNQIDYIQFIDEIKKILSNQDIKVHIQIEKAQKSKLKAMLDSKELVKSLEFQ